MEQDSTTVTNEIQAQSSRLAMGLERLEEERANLDATRQLRHAQMFVTGGEATFAPLVERPVLTGMISVARVLVRMQTALHTSRD
jgi:hypothetical protein